MANGNIGPGMYGWVVFLELYLFFIGKHEICIMKNGGSKWEEWPLQTWWAQHCLIKNKSGNIIHNVCTNEQQTFGHAYIMT